MQMHDFVELCKSTKNEKNTHKLLTTPDGGYILCIVNSKGAVDVISPQRLFCFYLMIGGIDNECSGNFRQ